MLLDQFNYRQGEILTGCEGLSFSMLGDSSPFSTPILIERGHRHKKNHRHSSDSSSVVAGVLIFLVEYVYLFYFAS